MAEQRSKNGRSGHLLVSEINLDFSIPYAHYYMTDQCITRNLLRTRSYVHILTYLRLYVRRLPF